MAVESSSSNPERWPAASARGRCVFCSSSSSSPWATASAAAAYSDGLLNLIDPDVHYQCISRRAAAYPAIGGIGRKSYLELEVEEDDEREE
jgi:hypothetical protein